MNYDMLSASEKRRVCEATKKVLRDVREGQPVANATGMRCSGMTIDLACFVESLAQSIQDGSLPETSLDTP